MVAIGILYLIFEKKLLLKSKPLGDSTAPADNSLSRSLIGVQVRLLKSGEFHLSNLRQIGFIILAMIVTKSSALSLQAKLGLPRGNQIVGWNVLGKTVASRRTLIIYRRNPSATTAHAPFPSSTTQ
jgi:phosphatidylinositol glycan class N